MSEKGSLSSLLKYRFNKRASDKMNHSDSKDSESGDGALSNGASSSNAAEPSGDNSGSPVFNKKFGRPESSGDAASPWLSKSHGMTSNGDQKMKGETDATATLTSESQSPGEEGGSQGDAQQWEQQLRTNFPAATSLQVRAAVAAATRAGNFEAGEDYLVKGNSALKRSHQEVEEEEDDAPQVKATYKRIRIMSGDSDTQSTLPLSLNNSQHVNDSQRTESYSLGDTQRTESYSLSQSEETSVEFLREAFPGLPHQRLCQVLRDCHGNTDQAVVVLSSDVKDAEQKARPQSSTARGTRTTNNGKHESLSLSDEDEDYDEEEDEDSDDSVDADKNTSKQELILSFLEEATLVELMVLPGCSRKKAEALIELRPFGSWEKMMEMLKNAKSLSYSLVHGCYEIIQLRNVVVRLMKQCEQISGQMELVVSKLTGRLDGPHDDEDQVTTQPKLLNAELELKPYQLIGLNWLRIMHSQQLNGILADEMGLGKTIQAIAFLAHLMEEGEEGPHVIIVPSSTIENWLREMALWCPALGVIVYYGSPEERRATRHSIMYEGRENFHVLLTTYNMATGGVEDRSLFKKFQFHYAVFDEGHMLKNMSSLRFQNLMKISAERRLLLTGTPLQNNLLELMSLLCFVMPDIFQGKTESLKKMFSMISRGDNEQGKYEKERIAQAQRIMRPFVLRRLKKDVLTQLPAKQEEVKYCPLLPAQQDLYNGLVTRFSQEAEEGDTLARGGMAMFMQLRKVANHPLLVRNHYDDYKLLQMANALAKEPSHRDRGAIPKLIMEDMAQMNDFDLIALCKQYKKHLGKHELDASWIGESTKFKVLDSLLPALQEQEDRVLLFSQFTMMLDVVEVYLKQKKIRYLRLDGSTPVTERQQLIDRFNEDQDIFIFLLSTRAGGLGINLTAANTIILHDIDFNPYNDKQAEDRCHRLGQKKTVKVIRLICRNTVEEGMLRVARAKLRLGQDVTTANDDADDPQADVANLLQEAIGKVKEAERVKKKLNSKTLSAASNASSSAS
ncbi:SWI/SNF-related matrix-associated actin-dependent regulator of chromatin subfamily A containing DEAD/H box 1B-like isoform X2 [Littorina saxatilis]|uniref:SWI/SNF-related matrix-associated actin-dependent regulator of chromatin subfamily A containing DEAD/H box 1B-like isoform X2 n=1 Tax=Littorina saxatilis TaxID=31220 RepID=UPI0038B6A65E